MTEEDAAAIMWTLTSPEVHRLLREVRGWPVERYTAWLHDSVVRMLLDEAPGRTSATIDSA